jgi:hypothetical protein
MDFYFSAKVWDKSADAPHTSKRAMPTATEHVRNARVIVVKDAKYRGAIFDGTFLLGDNNELPFPRKDMHGVEVYCCWFGYRLKTSGLNFTVDMSKAKVINNFSGDVASNLSIPEENINQPKNHEAFDINGYISPSKQPILKNEQLSLGTILFACVILLFVSSFLKNSYPINSFEWAYFLGEAVGIAVFVYIVNYFFKFYGVVIALILYAVHLLY